MVELVARSAGHVAPSLFLGYPSYLVEDVEVRAVASDVEPLDET